MFWGVFLTYIIVVILPVVFWLWFFRRADRAEPEPKKLLSKVFLGGILVVVLASIAEGVLEGLFFPEISAKLAETAGLGLGDFSGSPQELLSFLMIYFLAGPIEELMKFLVMKGLVYRRIAFNQVADGLIYGVTIALSFALIENSFYFVNILGEISFSGDFIVIVVARGVITTLLHLVAAAIMGLYLGRAKFAREKRTQLMAKGVIIAALVHGIYNVSIFFSFGIITNLILLTVCFRYIMRELKTDQSQMVWRLVVPAQKTAHIAGDITKKETNF